MTVPLSQRHLAGSPGPKTKAHPAPVASRTSSRSQHRKLYSISLPLATPPFCQETARCGWRIANINPTPHGLRNNSRH